MASAYGASAGAALNCAMPMASPNTVKAACAIISAVMSTTAEEKAITDGIPPNTPTRAPITTPPIWVKGNKSLAESRNWREAMNTQNGAKGPTTERQASARKKITGTAAKRISTKPPQPTFVTAPNTGAMPIWTIRKIASAKPASKARTAPILTENS